MMTNELLEEKYRAQRLLTEQGGDDLEEYARNLQRIVRDIERSHGFRFRYREVKAAPPARRKTAAKTARHDQAR